MNLIEEIECLTEKLSKTPNHAEFDPNKFRQMCIDVGATKLFDAVHKSMLTKRKSKKRSEHLKKRTLAIIYTMCNGKNQRINQFQKLNTQFLMSSNVNKEAMNTERNIGISMSTTSSYRIINKGEARHQETCSRIIRDATNNGWLITSSIDDYTTIHSRHRPQDQKASSAINMCTIIFRVYTNLPAIPNTNPNVVHDPLGVNSDLLKNEFLQPDNLFKLSTSFHNTMPPWLKEEIRNPLNARSRINIHEYQQSIDVQKLRNFENLYLLEFFEQTLKSLTDFKTAIAKVIDSELGNYLKRYVIPMPGDHPAQFFIRQAVYEKT